MLAVRYYRLENTALFELAVKYYRLDNTALFN